MIKTTFLLAAGLVCSAVMFSQNASDLFISEYVEGSSWNKYIEIFNGTGAAVDLSDYEVHVFTNGEGDLANPKYRVELGGIMTNMSVFVVAHSSAEIFPNPDLFDGSLNFNGDDAVCLFKVSAGNYLDVFGCIGMDPGSRWTSGDFRTLDRTLVRKSSIDCGASMTDNETDFNTLGSEWEQLAIDDFSNLGEHTFGNVTGISGVKEESFLKVSPNPVSDWLYIDSSQEITSIKVFSFSGETVLSLDEPLSDGVEVSALPQGFYLLSAKFVDGTVRSAKFCKR